MTKLIFPVITSKMATRYPEREIEGAKPNLRKKIKIFSRKLLIVFVIKSGYYIYLLLFPASISGLIIQSC